MLLMVSIKKGNLKQSCLLLYCSCYLYGSKNGKSGNRIMKYFLLLLLCVACVQARGLKCIEMLNVDIAFDKFNVPEKFMFTFENNVASSESLTLFPVKKAVDYDGVVQFKSKDAILTYHISYENSENGNMVDSADVVQIKSLAGKTDSVALADLWGAGDLFSKGSLNTEKVMTVRFLIPMLEKRNADYALLNYACTNWHDLREVKNVKK